MIENFQASHGWLLKWKNRFDIKFKDMVGEGNQVTPEMVAPLVRDVTAHNFKISSS